MTILFDRVLRHRCPNDVQALIPPTYDKLSPFERVDDHREQVRAALWQFGGIVTVAARYLRVDPAVFFDRPTDSLCTIGYIKRSFTKMY
jgi:hypothetical protein